MKNLILIVIVLLVLVGGVFAYTQFQNSQQVSLINSFQDCVDAGYPVMDSYPEQCKTPDGRTFIQDISEDQELTEYSDLIVVENPRPNMTISSPLQITGRARGTWYFEANFPIELLDANGASLAVAFATAKGEWMTEDFVPFTAELTFDTPLTKTGELVISNANPSGLSENEKTFRIPVTF